MSNRDTADRAIWPYIAVALIGVAGVAIFLGYWVHPSLEAWRLAADFSKGVAWPLAALVLALLFRRPIKDVLQILIGRLAEGDSFEATFPGGHLRVERFRPEVGQSKVAEAIDADGPPADQPDPPVPSTGGPDAGRPDRLIDIDPDMAMLKAFIELETVARSKYYDLGIASKDKKSNFGRRPFSVAYLIPHLDAPVREAVLYLRGVRNGVVHGTESGYSETEASAYVRQAKAITHILRHNRGAILW